MHHTNKRLPSATRWVVGALAAFLPLAVHALGLGKLTVRSALNEPLNAEIEITSISDKELKGLQVGLPPRADFDQAGVERLSFLGEIKFNVSKRADGNYFIQLLTDRQIEEPFLHLLLAVEWPGGKMVREYTALIDPPVLAAGKPAGIDVPQSAAAPTTPVVSPAPRLAQPMPEPVAPEPVAKQEPMPMQPPAVEPAPAPSAAEHKPMQAAPAEIPAPPAYAPPAETTAAVEPLTPKSTPITSRPDASVAAGWAMEGGYKVKWGDTAWRIAETMRTDDRHSIEQIVLALYRTNPQAFFESNVNNLKAGQILKIPESTEIDAVAPVQARNDFRAQYDAWQEYKIKLAGASSAIKVVDTEPKTGAPAESAAKEAKPAKPEPPNAAKVPEKAAKAPTAPTDKAQQDELLKIVRSTLQGEKTTPDKKPADGETARADTAREQQSLADRVATLEESLVSKQSESKEIGEKLAQVRTQLKRESRLIQIEQQQLAAAQAKAQPTPTEPAPAPKVQTPAKPAEPAPAPKAEAPAAAPKPTLPPSPPPVAAKPAPAPRTPVPAAAEEKSFVEELLDNVLGGDSLLPVLLGAVLLVSGGIALVYINRRRKSIAEFEESILQSEGIGGPSGEAAVTTDTSGQVVSTGDTSFLSDFSQGGMGNIHTDEVDPIAEAEVYLAYGRDETAEEILKEAMVKNPAREELKLKLLEIYANRSDVRAFETLAEEMYAAMGGRPSKNWPRVEDLGRKLNPNNPMFKGGAAAAGAAPAFVDTMKMKSAMSPAAAAHKTTDTQTGLIPPPSPGGSTTEHASGFDFDIGGASAPADAGFDLDIGNGDAAAKAADDAIDFSVDVGKDDTESGSTETGKGNAEFDGGLNLDSAQSSGNVVDFDFGDKEEQRAAAAPETELAIAAAPAASSAETGEAPQWDETATKLDLARAYIDMGDSEGARSILDEVMSEGNEQQKKQAKELSTQIG